MQVTVLTENLQKKISFLNHAISTRSQLPILQHILLKADAGKLYLSATDLEIGIQTVVAANVEEEGEITVPARSFIDVISSLSPGKTTLTLKDSLLHLSSSRVQSNFQTIEATEFPKLFTEKGKEVARFAKQTVDEKLNTVVFAAGTDVSRPAFTGVLMKFEKDGVLLVATDAFRLSLQFFPLALQSTQQPLLVQSRVFKEIISIKEDDDIVVYASEENNQALFEQGETIVVGRLIDAVFPTYEKIIPQDHATETSFDKEALLKAVRICAIFARETDDVIKLTLEKDKIIVSANTPNIGDNTVEIEAQLTGEENAIAFNAKYLLDFLTHIANKELIFQMQGPLNPVVFKIQGSSSFLHLIMPIRVQE